MGGGMSRTEEEYVKVRQQVDGNIAQLSADRGGPDHDRHMRETQELLQEADELMEAMELEAADTETINRLRDYKKTAKDAKDRLLLIQAGYDRAELLDGGMSGADEMQAKTFEQQRAKIESGSERLRQ